MGWIIFSGAACITAFVFVPLNEWKRLYPAGIITLILIYLIEITFIRLGAYKYNSTYFLPGDVPTFYWISSFFGGIILAYYYPVKKQKQFPYVLLTAGIFWAMEHIMHWLGYFQYQKWSSANSYFLNTIGFITVLWLAQWFNAIGKN